MQCAVKVKRLSITHPAVHTTVKFNFDFSLCSVQKSNSNLDFQSCSVQRSKSNFKFPLCSVQKTNSNLDF